MKKTLTLLNDLRIASPCTADWDQMHGTDQVRHCSQCNLNVYNLSQMTEEAATALVVEKEGRLCVRFYRRTDGTMLTQDCPLGWPARAWRRVRNLAAATFALVGWLFAVGCQEPTMGMVVSPTDGPKDEPAKVDKQKDDEKKACPVFIGAVPFRPEPAPQIVKTPPNQS